MKVFSVTRGDVRQSREQGPGDTDTGFVTLLHRNVPRGPETFKGFLPLSSNCDSLAPFTRCQPAPATVKSLPSAIVLYAMGHRCRG